VELLADFGVVAFGASAVFGSSTACGFGDCASTELILNARSPIRLGMANFDPVVGIMVTVHSSVECYRIK
jgi:hypothetical protein